MEIGVEITNFEEVKKWNFEEIRNAFFQDSTFLKFFKNTRWISKKWKSEKVKSQSLYYK